MVSGIQSVRCCSRFHIVGGECNYLLRVNSDYKLEFVPDSEWMSPCMLTWTPADITSVLDAAQAVLVDTAKHLRLPVKVKPFCYYLNTAACSQPLQICRSMLSCQ